MDRKREMSSTPMPSKIKQDTLSYCIPFSTLPTKLHFTIALNFEILDLGGTLLVYRYIFRIFRPSSYIKIIAHQVKVATSQEQKTCLCILFVGGLISIDRQSCLTHISRFT